jgi:hypothetical protein
VARIALISAMDAMVEMPARRMTGAPAGQVLRSGTGPAAPVDRAFVRERRDD